VTALYIMYLWSNIWTSPVLHCIVLYCIVLCTMYIVQQNLATTCGNILAKYVWNLNFHGMLKKEYIVPA